MIVVHHLENSRSQRVLWALEEFGCAYEIERYERDPKTMLAPASLRAIHPLGKSPVIVDDGRTIAESGAILQYLAERYGDGALMPAAERDRITYFLHYAEGSLQPYLLMKLVFSRLGMAPTPLPVRPIGRVIAAQVGKRFLDPNIARNLAFCEAELAGREWFGGDAFSIADIQMSFPLEGVAARDGLGGRLGRFLERIHARPAYRRALERGGPYSLEF
jgi:glutathione S-transferase